MKLTAEISDSVRITTGYAIGKVPGSMYKAVMKAGGLVKNQAAMNAPSPKTAKALKVIGKNKNGSGPESNTGIDHWAKGWYGKFFESGARRHEIKAKNGKVLSWLRVGGNIEFAGKKVTEKYYITKNGQHSLNADSSRNFITAVNHPGMKKKPFLLPAYQKLKPEIQQLIADATLQLMSEAAKAGGGK